MCTYEYTNVYNKVNDLMTLHLQLAPAKKFVLNFCVVIH